MSYLIRLQGPPKALKDEYLLILILFLVQVQLQLAWNRKTLDVAPSPHDFSAITCRELHPDYCG